MWSNVRIYISGVCSAKIDSDYHSEVLNIQPYIKNIDCILKKDVATIMLPVGFGLEF